MRDDTKRRAACSGTAHVSRRTDCSNAFCNRQRGRQEVANTVPGDRIGERRQYEARLAELGGKDDDGPLGYKRIKLASYEAQAVSQDKGPIGVVTIAGEIVDGKAGPGTAGAETITRAIEKGLAKDDPDILGKGVGVGLRKGDTELKDKVNAAIKAIRANGTYEAFSKKYFDFDVYGD